MKRRRKPHRIRRKKSILKSRFFRNLALVSFIVFAGFYFLFLSKFFQIAEIIITAQGEFLDFEVEPVVKAEAKNIFLTNTSEIKKALLQKFPQIAEVEVKKSFPNILNLALAERKEVGIFCQEDSCFLIDREGVVFKSVFEDFPIEQKIKSNNVSGEVAPGDRVFDEETLEIILEVDKKLKNNLSIIAKEFLLVGRDRLDVTTAEGWEIYFNLKKDIDWQTASLATILEKRILPEKRTQLKYIDLRFDKIFVYPEP